MIRNQQMVLNSIASLIDEAGKLAVRMGMKVNRIEFEQHDLSNLVPQKQISQITDTLVRLSNVIGTNNSNRQELESMVGRIFDTSVKAWLESNLDSIVKEAMKERI